jgi:hypothetical protein
MNVALVTVSYRGDLSLAGELCASIDQCAGTGMEHVLIVPASDVDLFAPLCTGRRRIASVESVLPKNFRRVLKSFRLRIGPYSKRFREMWLTPAGLIRGWIMQQIVKLSSDAATDADIIVFADSDLIFIAPLTMNHLVRDGHARLYLRPGETRESPKHRSWHRAAATLVGLPATDYFGADYIGNPISWRRDVLAKLKERIEKVTGQHWQTALAATPTFSEFVLYGVFADHVLGANESGHFHDETDLTHASWHYDVGQDGGIDSFVKNLGAEQIAVLIQSTEDLGIEDRRRLVQGMLATRSTNASYLSRTETKADRSGIA